MEYISVTFCRTVLAFLVMLDSLYCRENGENLKGHLQPIFTFGVRQTVPVFKGFPSPFQFFRDYVSHGKPVLLQNAAKSFPAFQKWSDEYFLSYPEGKKFVVNVESRKKENRSQQTNDVPFSTFINYYRDRDIYMVDSIPEYLRKDVLIPSCLSCQDITKGNMINLMMWMSNGGTKSVLHNDHAENINCVFKGSKTFFLVDGKYMDIMNVTEVGYSDVDVDSVDLVKYPGLYNIEHYKVNMEAGDCLYIPFLWVHQVTSRDHNIAVNFWWKEKVEVNFDDCNATGTLTAGDVNVVGFGGLHEAHHKMIRGHLNRRIREKGPMMFEDLVEVIEKEVLEIDDNDSETDEEIIQELKQIFRLLDSFQTDGVVTKEDVDNMAKDDLETIRTHLANIVEIQKQKIALMENLEQAVELDGQEAIPDWTHGEIPPVGMGWEKNGPQTERHSSLPPPQETVRTKGQTSDFVEESLRMRMPLKKLHSSKNKMSFLEMQWKEMIKKRRLSLQRREEL